MGRDRVLQQIVFRRTSRILRQKITVVFEVRGCRVLDVTSIVIKRRVLIGKVTSGAENVIGEVHSGVRAVILGIYVSSGRVRATFFLKDL